MHAPRMSCDEFLTDETPGLGASDAPVLNRGGLDLYRQGDLLGASEAFREAAQADPTLAEAWNNAGVVRQRLGDLAGAVADFERAIAAKADYAEAHNNLGRARHEMGDSSAAAEFDRALECATGRFRAVVLHNRGMLRHQVGDLPRAIEDFGAALEIAPDRLATLLGRGAARKEASDLDGALADFESALDTAQGAERAAALHGRGGVRVLRKDFAGAVADYDQALQIDPRLLAATISRGHARYHLRDPRALVDYRSALRMDPEGAVREFARFCLDDVIRDPEAVLKNCDQHLRIDGRDAVARVRRGLALSILGSDATQDLTHFVALAPDLVEDLNRLVEVAKELRLAALDRSSGLSQNDLSLAVVRGQIPSGRVQSWL